MSNFWNAIYTPNRKNLFKVTIGDLEPFTAKTVSKPSISVNTHEHQIFNHKFYFPGIVTWEPVEATFADGGSETGSPATALLAALTSLGYVTPDTKAMGGALIKKSDFTATIQQLNAAGEVLSMWTLSNAWIEKYTFGDLSYEDDGIVELSLTLRYDYAELTGS